MGSKKIKDLGDLFILGIIQGFSIYKMRRLDGSTRAFPRSLTTL